MKKIQSIRDSYKEQTVQELKAWSTSELSFGQNQMQSGLENRKASLKGI